MERNRRKKTEKKKYVSPRLEKIILEEGEILTADCDFGTNTPILGDCGACEVCIRWGNY
ncbi:MAG: hypothetical protein J7J54_00350 [Candidatus Omnitrophica bacterium]|nr:hypothetical protein [Candidatus Omnitrophota bacterium]